VLEQWLCKLFAEVAGMQGKQAAIVFFKIVSKRAVNDILTKLIKLKYEGKYSTFWNSYLKQLRTVDNKRNDIVHWVVEQQVRIKSGHPHEIKVCLIPPHLWGDEPEQTSNSIEDLAEFIAKCNAFSLLCRTFLFQVAYRRTGPAPPWRDIYQQPLVYPLPSDHPLSQTAQKQQSQPPPSPE
jgi:hypothetical protein